ncbi:MAG: caspase family protein [Nitrospira sp.]
MLIAIDDYEAWKHLSNPIHDARAVAADLRGIYGFETELVENPTLSQVFEIFEKYMKRKFSPHDQLVIFIAGHGTYKDDTREGFLITKDSKSKKEDTWGHSFLSHARLGQIVDHFHIGHILVILDACFGGTFDQRIAEAGHRGGDEYPELSADEFKNRK